MCIRDRFRAIAPSIAFPESHDTERLAEENGGDERVSRLRYLFAAAFSSGLMLTMGYEYGFRRKLNVVTTRPEDWETPGFDLSPVSYTHLDVYKRQVQGYLAEGR